MYHNTDHIPNESYNPTPEQKRCKHKRFVRTEGRYPQNRLKPSPDFYYNVCSKCGARGYDGMWVIKHYVDSDVHDFVYGHAKEDCTDNCPSKNKKY